jgi:hypothetical protein
MNPGSDMSTVDAPLTDLTRIEGSLLHAGVSHSGLGVNACGLAEFRAGTNGPQKGESMSRGIGPRSSRELSKRRGPGLEIEGDKVVRLLQLSFATGCYVLCRVTTIDAELSARGADMDRLPAVEY